jgi:alpha-glucan,water dikinase
VPSEYAYVIHTVNPTNDNENEVYVEACKGLGEALVSDMGGQAFSFGNNKTNGQCNIGHYPNKPQGLISKGFIFRSDSNSEDLPGFAGAGLFDSYTMNEEDKFRIAYNQEKLLFNDQFKSDFMHKLGQVGIHIEQVYNGEAQDIEGCFYNNEYYVV